MKLAKQLCPEAVIIRGNTHNYMKYSDMVSEIVQGSVPVFEKTSIDEFYCDLTGMDKFFGCYRFAAELRQRVIQETGLPISFGLSANKTVSKVATGEAKPNNQMWVEQGTERPFLSPLSIRKIPMVGDKTYQTLRNMGIQRIGTVQEMKPDLLHAALGENGLMIWKKANGEDNSPVVAYQERKSISAERTFDKDTIDVAKLRSILVAMTENLAYQLRKGHKLTSCITVKIRYSDFQTHTMQCRIPYSSSDHLIMPAVHDLFSRLFDRRMLVRLIGLKFSHLVSGGQQINLFDESDERQDLYTALDEIRNKFGDRAIMSAAGLNVKSIGGSGNPFAGGPPILLANRRQ
jgi:DNA polymerase-4